MANRTVKLCTCKSVGFQFHIRLAITSVWKVKFQQFKHFSVANNEFFHMVHLTQNYFSTQIWPKIALVPWIIISMIHAF